MFNLINLKKLGTYAVVGYGFSLAYNGIQLTPFSTLGNITYGITSEVAMTIHGVYEDTKALLHEAGADKSETPKPDEGEGTDSQDKVSFFIDDSTMLVYSQGSNGPVFKMEKQPTNVSADQENVKLSAAE